MSIHWTQEQATMFPIAIIRGYHQGIIKEEYFTFISVDLKHDVPFVELCNSIIHGNDFPKDIKLDHEIEFNDGCSSKFKFITAISVFAQRSVKSTKIYFKPVMTKTSLTDLEMLLNHAPNVKFVVII